MATKVTFRRWFRAMLLRTVYHRPAWKMIPIPGKPALIVRVW